MNRKLLIAKANELIATSPTRQQRIELRNFIASMLIAANSYKGFNYTTWQNGGYECWLTAGKPDDTTPFLGDTSMIRFY